MSEISAYYYMYICLLQFYFSERSQSPLFQSLGNVGSLSVHGEGKLVHVLSIVFTYVSCFSFSMS